MLIYKGENWFTKIAEYLLYVFIVSFPFLNYTSFLYFGSVTRSINLIFVGSIFTLGLGFVLLQKKTEVSLMSSKITSASFIFLLSVVLIALFGVNFETSFFSNITRTTGIWFLVSLSLFSLVLVKLFESREVRKKIVYSIVFSTALFSLFSALSKEGLGTLFTSWSFDGFTFGNSTFAGMYLFAGFILSISLWFRTQFRWWKPLLSLIIICNPFIVAFRTSESSGMFAFLGEARASALALFGSVVVISLGTFIFRINNEITKKRIFYVSTIIGILGIIFGAFSLVSQNGFLRQVYLSQATGARPLVWEVSERLIKEKPFLGFGIENFEKVFEVNYDNRILESQYGSEPWFDRAHNLFIDQLLENGVVGVLLYLFLFVTLCFTLLKIYFSDTTTENKSLAFLILVYAFFHIFELQTSFETSISYVSVMIIVSLAIALEREVLGHKERVVLPWLKYILAVLFLVWGVVSIFSWFMPFVMSGIVNGKIREVGSAEKRLPLYDTLFATPVDLQAVLWRTLTDFERGISENPKVLGDQKKVAFLQRELERFESEYAKYVEKNPKNFRALLNFADAKIYFMLFGVNKLNEAHLVLDKAIELVPQAPQPYRMKAVAYLYMQDFNKAREWAKKAYDLNPNVEETKNLVKYIEDSIKTFPEIDLYFFKQI